MPAAVWKAATVTVLKSRDIARLRGDVAVNCRLFIKRCAAAGLPVRITETVRDQEYQAGLYAQGRTKPGKIVTNQKLPSFHWVRAALAFDICKDVPGHAYDDPVFFRRCGAIGKEMGFTWGGDWKSFPDAPHFQWDSHGVYTAAMVRAGRLPPAMPEFKEKEGQRVAKLTKDEAKELLRKKAGLSEATIQYLDSYRFGDELIIKLGGLVK